LKIHFYSFSTTLIYTELSKQGINMDSETASEYKIGTTTVKKGLAQMLKGGVIVSYMLLCFGFVALVALLWFRD
jgi:hypothetical protein